MAITINGSGTVTGITAGGLPDGCVDNDTIADGTIANAKLVNNSVTVNGTAIDLGASDTITAGKILQVVQAFDDAYYQTGASGGGSFYDVISASITPSSTSSKILITGHLTTGQNTAYGAGVRIIVNNSYDIASAVQWVGTTGRLYAHTVGTHGSNTHDCTTYPVNYLHSPATTSPISYKLQVAARDRAEWAKNGPWDNNDSNTFYRVQGTTCLQLWEIAG